MGKPTGSLGQLQGALTSSAGQLLLIAILFLSSASKCKAAPEIAVLVKVRLKQGFQNFLPCQSWPLLTCMYNPTSSSKLHHQQLSANPMLLP